MPDYPSITALSLPKEVDLKNSGEIIISAAAFDNDGIDSVVIFFDKNVTITFNNPGVLDPSTWDYLGIYGSSNSWSDGISWEDYYLTSSNPLGNYEVTKIRVTDVYGYWQEYSKSQLDMLGYNTSFELIDSSIDITRPILTSFSMPTQVDLANNGELVISASAFDSESGIYDVTVWFNQNIERSYISDGTPYNYKVHGLYGVQDSWEDGVSVEDWFLTNNNALGIYSIDYVEVKDNSGNSIRYYKTDLDALGFNTSFELIDNSNITYTVPSSGMHIVHSSNGDATVNASYNVSDSKTAVQIINQGDGSTILNATSSIYGGFGVSGDNKADGIYVKNESINSKELPVGIGASLITL